MDISSIILDTPSSSSSSEIIKLDTVALNPPVISSSSSSSLLTDAPSSPKIIPMEDISLLTSTTKTVSVPPSDSVKIVKENTPGLKNSILLDDTVFSSPPSTVSITPTAVTPIVLETISSNSNSPKEAIASPSSSVKPLSNILDSIPVNFQVSNTIDMTPTENNTNNKKSETTTKETSATASSSSSPNKTFEDLQKEKQDLLFRLERMAKRGIPMSKRHTMASTVEEIREEYTRIKSQKDLDNSVKFQRKMLMAFVTGIEFLNTKFDPFDVQLDGWSESIHENLEEYDEIFEELHEKYKERAKMAPELKLLMSLGGSAFMYHLSQSLFKSVMPSANDLFKQNPELMKQMGQATMNMMNQQSSPTTSSFSQFMQDAMPKQYKPTTPSPPTAAAAVPPPPLRKEMKGPMDIDDIIQNITGSIPTPRTMVPPPPPPPSPSVGPPPVRINQIRPASSVDISSHADQLKQIEVQTIPSSTSDPSIYKRKSSKNHMPVVPPSAGINLNL